MNKDERSGWEATTFEGARREMLRMGMRTTFREKLQWLEEASRIAEKLAATTTVNNAHKQDRV
jgi:hypothetical protein